MNKDIAVRFDSVSFSYGEAQVIENASFHIHKSEFVSMVGPNGSGKTTVLKLLFGLETPDSGSIEIFGNTYTDKKKGVMQNLAYVPQMPPADKKFPITVRDIVRMGLLRPLKGYSSVNAAVEEAMERAGIAELAGKQYGSLSGGQKRRALVARALAANPQLLVLDEPTANMDADSEARLYETLAFYKGKTTILIVTHDTEFVSSLTDRVLCLGDGSRSIVQHGVDYNDKSVSHEGGEKRYGARVLHSENLPEDGCCN
jgi:zinc transport system ATP-binding protein